jgi:hypothetical protein
MQSTSDAFVSVQSTLNRVLVKLISLSHIAPQLNELANNIEQINKFKISTDMVDSGINIRLNDIKSAYEKIEFTLKDVKNEKTWKNFLDSIKMKKQFDDSYNEILIKTRSIMDSLGLTSKQIKSPRVTSQETFHQSPSSQSINYPNQQLNANSPINMSSNQMIYPQQSGYPIQQQGGYQNQQNGFPAQQQMNVIGPTPNIIVMNACPKCGSAGQVTNKWSCGSYCCCCCGLMICWPALLCCFPQNRVLTCNSNHQTVIGSITGNCCQ